MPHHPRAILPILGSLALIVTGCASTPTPAPGAQGRPIVIDGETREWPLGVRACADESAYYVLIDSSATWPLQAARETTVVALDLDNDVRTGRRAEGGELGVDLVVRFSPPSEREAGAFAPGMDCQTFDPDGRAATHHQSRLGAVALPTFAAPEHELRIERGSPALAGLSDRVASGGAFRGRVERRDASGALISADEVFVSHAPARVSRQPDAAPPPRKGAGELRVVAFNVLWNSPMKNPAPFARVLRALDPDIVLVQEWDQREFEAPLNTSAQLEAWFREHVPGDYAWAVHRGQGRGVAVVSRYPLRPLIDAIEVRTDVQGSARATIEQDVRFVAAMADTPLGAVLVSSLHLKCCGSSDGPEDLRRAGEAYAINSALRDIIAKQRPVTTVIAGDFNLVGSDRPMEIMRSGLDADRSDLLAAPALVWGDRARYTFRDIAGPFQPGALDYVVVGDASVEVARSFVLDTSLLSPGALRQMGLQDAQDGAVSDHLPTVVDLRPRPRAGK